MSSPRAAGFAAIKCCMCLVTEIKGIYCNDADGPHFICCNCFSDFVSSVCTQARQSGKIGKSASLQLHTLWTKILMLCSIRTAKDGNIVCPFLNCSADTWILRDFRLMVIFGGWWSSLYFVILDRLLAFWKYCVTTAPGESPTKILILCEELRSVW